MALSSETALLVKYDKFSSKKSSKKLQKPFQFLYICKMHLGTKKSLDIYL